MKNLIEKIVPTGDELKTLLMQTGAIWAIGRVANVVANSVFHFDLNKYNSVDHAILGFGFGTYAYQKAGGGVKGFLAGLTAATIFNAGWEYSENRFVFKSSFDDTETAIDTISDIAVVYVGTVLSFAGQKLRDYKKYPHGKEKWVL
jgi:hypothetical protein